MCWKNVLSLSLLRMVLYRTLYKAALYIDLAVRSRRQPAVHLLGRRKDRGTAGQGWLNNMRRRNNVIKCQG